MPSPFPGMDPYLESPAYWRDFHHNFITSLSAALNRDLPEGFAATIDERIYIVPPERTIFPDVAVLQRPSVTRGGQGDARVASRSSAATLEAPSADMPLIVSLRTDPIYEGFIEVRTTNRAADLVAVIEVLSPANKEPGSEGRAQYQRKQREILASNAHLIEIDLLRAGEHTVAPQRDLITTVAERWNYLICLHRAAMRWQHEVWPATVHESLPRVSVPLTGDLPDTTVDLQTAFERAYDLGPYRRLVDYREEPLPPLSSEDTAWSDVLLREKGLRPTD